MKHSEALERGKHPQLAFLVFNEAAHYLTAVHLIFSE